MPNISEINGYLINADTASYAVTASFLSGSVTSASYAATASYSTTLGATLSNQSDGTLRLVNSANTSISSVLVTASLANTASYVLNAISSSFAATASLAPNYVLNSATSSFVQNSQTSSFVQNSQTSSFVTNSQTSSFVLNSQTSSMTAGTASKVQGGTANYIPLWSAATTLGSSVLYQNGTSIGLGTTSPNTNLHISASSAQPLLNIENSTVNGYSNMRFTGTGKKFVIGVGNASETTFGVANEFFIYDDSVGAIRTVVDTNGNVGVGTTSPGALIHVNGTGIIATSLAVGTSSLGSTENALVVGLPPAGGVGEGGQILLQASGGLYTSASMIDNYQNKFRILRGTNASSDAFKFQVDMHTGQVSIPNYNSATALTGTEIAALGVDTNGNVLTTTIPGTTIFGQYGGTGFTNPIVTYLPFGFTTVSGAEAQRQVASPVAGSLKNFFLRTNNTSVVGSTTTFTIRINGVNTNIKITIGGGVAAAKFSDTTNSASIAVGDEISLQVSTSAGNGPQVNAYSFGIYPS